MNIYAPEKIRNVALVGHSSSGKTSLVEAVLYSAGGSNRLGTIDDGTTHSDYTEAEIDRMKRDADEHASEDKQRRELVDTRNQAQNLVFQMRKQLEEHGDKVPSEVRGQIESAINDVEAKIKEDNAEVITRSLDELQKVAMELGKSVYEQSKEDSAEEEGTAAKDDDERKKSDDVIDAEYEVKD